MKQLLEIVASEGKLLNERRDDNDSLVWRVKIPDCSTGSLTFITALFQRRQSSDQFKFVELQ